MLLTVPQVSGLQASKYVNVGGMAILIFDYAITLEDEVRWVWGRRWDVTRCIFMASRYLPFVGEGMTAYAVLRSDDAPCGPDLEANIIHMLGIIAAELLLVLRTYSFWQGNKRVLYGLLAYSGVTICAAVSTSVAPVKMFPGAQAPPGCYLTAPQNTALVYLYLLLFEIVIFSLTAYKRFRSYRDVKELMVHTIYRDSMFYIACVISITFANVLIDSIFAFQYSDLLDIPQLTLHSVLASRILFNLRRHSYMAEKGDITVSSGIARHRTHAAVRSIGSMSFESRDVTTLYMDMDVYEGVDVDIGTASRFDNMFWA